MEKTALYIPTPYWNRIIDGLVAEGWEVIKEYDGFDKGIDYNMIELEKQENKILFTWDNWSEGEIKAGEKIMVWLEDKFGVKFVYGDD